MQVVLGGMARTPRSQALWMFPKGLMVGGFRTTCFPPQASCSSHMEHHLLHHPDPGNKVQLWERELSGRNQDLGDFQITFLREQTLSPPMPSRSRWQLQRAEATLPPPGDEGRQQASSCNRRGVESGQQHESGPLPEPSFVKGTVKMFGFKMGTRVTSGYSSLALLSLCRASNFKEAGVTDTKVIIQPGFPHVSSDEPWRNPPPPLPQPKTSCESPSSIVRVNAKAPICSESRLVCARTWSRLAP